eukprot:TRINITY_DN12168_c1_g1_i2.p2 TRINITY_DN12168_c1_g1~~TRINITY_DN12168_c1_g1_i2.p2  ORF type:complete len:247 (-),score=34.52 TRINITY_DN12168_c1_g1_i2:429-1169(-)
MLEEVQYQWKLDEKQVKQKQLDECKKIKHRFQRTARECPNTIFLEVEADTDGGQELCDRLGIDIVPTLQFYKRGQLLWEHKGALHMEQDLGEGILFYGDQGAQGLKPSDFVTEIKSRQEFEEFVSQKDDKVLNCVLVSLTSASPCVRIYPAVVALGRSFKGYVNFARMMGDDNDEMQKVMGEKSILQVPTFMFYRNGEEVHRHVGSNRGDLIGQILEQQAKYGIQPPPTVLSGRRRLAKKAQAKSK